MSREIKFRMWDEKAKIFFLDGFSIDMDGYQWHDDNDDSWPFDDRFILEQFTGIKDKNGFEIYEGDIIEWYTSHKEGYPLDKTPERHTKVIEIKNLISGCFLYSFHQYEVIGNIHQNPEFL